MLRGVKEISTIKNIPFGKGIFNIYIIDEWHCLDIPSLFPDRLPPLFEPANAWFWRLVCKQSRWQLDLG